jgi:hypothetical protein
MDALYVTFFVHSVQAGEYQWTLQLYIFPLLSCAYYRNKFFICVMLSQVCPQLGLCPSAEATVALDTTHTVNDKPTCPLCLLAVQSLVEKLKDKKTEVRENLRLFSENTFSISELSFFLIYEQPCVLY